MTNWSILNKSFTIHNLIDSSHHQQCRHQLLATHNSTIHTNIYTDRTQVRTIGLGLALLGHGLVIGRKLQADAVNAVSFVGRRIVTLAFEDVTEMATAVGADNLGAGHAHRAVLMPSHGARQAVKVAGPAAA